MPLLQGRDLSADHVLNANADALAGKGTFELAVDEVLHAGADVRTRNGTFGLVGAFQRVKAPEQRRIILEEANRLTERKE